MTADDIAALFTQGDDFLCARWGRPVAPVVFGLDDASLAIFRDALKAVVAHARHPLADTDPVGVGPSGLRRGRGAQAAVRARAASVDSRAAAGCHGARVRHVHNPTILGRFLAAAPAVFLSLARQTGTLCIRRPARRSDGFAQADLGFGAAPLTGWA